MRLAVTGTPGVGKTTLSKELSKKFKLKYINEKEFALKNNLGHFNDDNELEIPIKKFEKKANLFLSKNKNVIFEGHIICEMKLNVDKIILLTIDPDELELRLEKRHYSIEKMMDNVFCEGINYCKKKVLKNYFSSKIIEIQSQNNVKSTFLLLLSKLLK
ncbi:MAG: AAA family ATPase [Candidatus ainarchaeum sp.]|nr:AAA family ATPase [Candidatus ainarchaeum sp.]